MWMVFVGGSFVAVLFVVLLSAWWSVFRAARVGDPLCQRCRARMLFAPSMIGSGFPFQCRRCRRNDPHKCDKVQRWIDSNLRGPE